MILQKSRNITISQFSSFVNLNLKLKGDLRFRNLLSLIIFEVVGWLRFLHVSNVARLFHERNFLKLLMLQILSHIYLTAT